MIHLRHTPSFVGNGPGKALHSPNHIRRTIIEVDHFTDRYLGAYSGKMADSAFKIVNGGESSSLEYLKVVVHPFKVMESLPIPQMAELKYIELEMESMETHSNPLDVFHYITRLNSRVLETVILRCYGTSRFNPPINPHVLPTVQNLTIEQVGEAMWERVFSFLELPSLTFLAMKGMITPVEKHLDALNPSKILANFTYLRLDR